jgi:hypothetical protein
MQRTGTRPALAPHPPKARPLGPVQDDEAAARVATSRPAPPPAPPPARQPAPPAGPTAASTAGSTAARPAGTLRPRRDDEDLLEDEYDDYDAEYDGYDEHDDEDLEEESPAREWLVMTSQLAIGAVGGAALWLGFQWLWEFMPVAALAVALVVITALVWVVRRIRHSDDLHTTVVTVLVGLFVTVSPAALLLLDR